MMANACMRVVMIWCEHLMFRQSAEPALPFYLYATKIYHNKTENKNSPGPDFQYITTCIYLSAKRRLVSLHVP